MGNSTFTQMDNAFFRNTLDSLEEQLAIVDRNGVIVFVNDSWKKFGEENGFNPEYDWIGVNYLDACRDASLHGDAGADSVIDGISSVLSGTKKSFEFEYPCHSPNEQRWFILRAVPVKGLGVAAYVLTHQNITLRKLAEQAVIYSSLHDPLTDLANRRHFDSFLSGEWRRCLREQASICIIMIDLDRFKNYNDEKGHLEGDACLKTVAGILRSNVTRGSDICARFGGDEFAVVLGDTPLEGGLLVANRIINKIRDLGLQISAGEAVTASIGLACGVPGMDRCTDEEAFMRQADSALYKAKAGGRNRIEVI